MVVKSWRSEARQPFREVEIRNTKPRPHQHLPFPPFNTIFTSQIEFRYTSNLSKCTADPASQCFGKEADWLTSYRPTIHPRTVHFPIAFLLASFGIDFAYGLGDRLPNFLASNLAPANDLTRVSYFLLSAGLITMVPALVTGIREAVVTIAKQGIYDVQRERDGGTKVRPKVAAMFIHAIFNDIVLGVAAYIWLQKRKGAQASLGGKLGLSSATSPAGAYAPENWMLYSEIPIFVLLLMSTNIGHVLVLNFGMGFTPGGGSGSAKKAQ